MPYKHDTTGDDTVPAYVSLTTDHVTTDAAGPLADALHAAGVAVERHAFLPVRGEEQHPWGALLLAASGPPLPLARLVVPASAPAGVSLSSRGRPRGWGWGTSGIGYAPAQGRRCVYLHQRPRSTRHNNGARRAPGPAHAPGHASGGTSARLRRERLAHRPLVRGHWDEPRQNNRERTGRVPWAQSSHVASRHGMFASADAEACQGLALRDRPGHVERDCRRGRPVLHVP